MNTHESIEHRVKGFVEVYCLDGILRAKYMVVDNIVLEPCFGRPSKVIGYVKKGVAYEFASKGNSKVIGVVRRTLEDR